MIHAASKILLNLFLPDLESVLAGAGGFALSPVSILHATPPDGTACLEMFVGDSDDGHGIVSLFDGFPPGMDASLSRYADNLPESVCRRAGLLLKRKLGVRAAFRAAGREKAASPGHYAEIRLRGRAGLDGPGVRIYFPLAVLGMISEELAAAEDADLLEKSLVDFFREPSRLFPDLGVILNVLDNREIQDLFYRLQKNRLLTTYQICLVIAAFPEHSLRVKRCISANTARDVAEMMKNLRKNRSVTRRDLAGGIYSVEEAVYGLMLRGEDFGFATFLGEHRELVRILTNMEPLLRFDFAAWLGKMEEDSLLYHALAAAGESDTARAVSGSGGRCIPYLERNMSAVGLSGILELSKKPCTVDERISAQCRIIALYRGLRVKKKNWGAESFEFLFRRVTRPSDFRSILVGTGWFTLSTALKGAAQASVDRVTGHLPAPARFLIEDVLRGVVNPNIIHDELQVDAARRRCVETMLSLEEEGVIVPGS